MENVEMVFMNNFRTFCQEHEKKIGTIASVLAIVMFVSLIEVFISNMQGKSTIIIQPLATSVNGFFWSMYAYGKRDYFLLIPNLIALALGAATAVSALV